MLVQRIAIPRAVGEGGGPVQRLNGRCGPVLFFLSFFCPGVDDFPTFRYFTYKLTRFSLGENVVFSTESSRVGFYKTLINVVTHIFRTVQRRRSNAALAVVKSAPALTHSD